MVEMALFLVLHHNLGRGMGRGEEKRGGERGRGEGREGEEGKSEVYFYWLGCMQT